MRGALENVFYAATVVAFVVALFTAFKRLSIAIGIVAGWAISAGFVFMSTTDISSIGGVISGWIKAIFDGSTF